MTPLRQLIESVEAGKYDSTTDRPHRFNQFCRDWDAARGSYTNQFSEVAWRAYRGSLDAALALHEALLPGWRIEGVHQKYKTKRWYVCMDKFDDPDAKSSALNNHSFARSWLLAILRAYEAQQEGEG